VIDLPALELVLRAEVLGDRGAVLVPLRAVELELAVANARLRLGDHVEDLRFVGACALAAARQLLVERRVVLLEVGQVVFDRFEARDDRRSGFLGSGLGARGSPRLRPAPGAGGRLRLRQLALEARDSKAQVNRIHHAEGEQPRHDPRSPRSTHAIGSTLPRGRALAARGSPPRFSFPPPARHKHVTVAAY
jgi:hypothetical protein